MTSHEKSSLDEKLRTIKQDVNWNSSRQQKIKSTIQTKMKSEKQHPIRRKVKGPLFPTLALGMVIGIMIILLLPPDLMDTETLTQSEEQYNDIVIEQYLPYELNGKTALEIKEMVDLGYLLNVPEVSLAHSKTDRVEINYIFKNDKEFTIIQEPLGEAIDVTIDRHSIGQGVEESIFVLENDEQVSLYLLTRNYGFLLQSTDLVFEQMVELAKVVDDINLEIEIVKDHQEDRSYQSEHPGMFYLTTSQTLNMSILDKYCWESEEKTCALEANDVTQTLEGIRPLTARKNQVIGFRMGTPIGQVLPAFDEISITQFRLKKESEVEVVQNSYFHAPEEPGKYYYIAHLTWNNERVGEAYYAFSIYVR